MAPPVDHFQVRRGAQLLVPMLDDPVLQPGSPGDRQRKTSSYTPSLAPIPPPRVLEEILWRRRSGISLGTPLATSPPLTARTE